MKILVTGGAGYIGSILVPCYCKKDMLSSSLTISCTVRPPSWTVVIIQTWKSSGEMCATKTCSGSNCDCGCDLAIGLPDGGPLCDRDPVGAQQINHDAVRFLAGQKSREQRLIFPCTNSGYGVGQDGIYCDESTPMRPISLYGKLKVELDRYLLDRGDCIT